MRRLAFNPESSINAAATDDDLAADRSQLEINLSLKIIGMLSVWPSILILPAPALKEPPSLSNMRLLCGLSRALPEIKASTLANLTINSSSFSFTTNLFARISSSNSLISLLYFSCASLLRSSKSGSSAANVLAGPRERPALAPLRPQMRRGFG